VYWLCFRFAGLSTAKYARFPVTPVRYLLQ
jgi:hypothetical protein